MSPSHLNNQNIDPEEEQRKLEREQDREKSKYQQKDKFRHAQEKEQLKRIMEEEGIPKKLEKDFSNYLHQVKKGEGREGNANYEDGELRGHAQDYVETNQNKINKK